MVGRTVLLLLGAAAALTACGDSEDAADVASDRGAISTPAERARPQSVERDRGHTERRRPTDTDKTTDQLKVTSTAPPEVQEYEPGPTPEQPRPGGPPPLPGRAAPATSAGPLRFTRVRVFRDAATGRTAIRANVTNRGERYLNSLRIRWRLVTSGGAVLDTGVTNWPTLAPGETAAIPFRGARKLRRGWSRVVFRLSG